MNPTQLSQHLTQLRQSLTDANLQRINPTLMLQEMAVGDYKRFYHFIHRLQNHSILKEDDERLSRLLFSTHPAYDSHITLLNGVLYEYGWQDRPRNLAKAYNCYQASHLKGNPEATARLGYFFAYGIHVKKSVDDAIDYLSLAAEKGSAAAQFLLGDITDNKTFVATAAQAEHSRALLHQASDAFFDKKYDHMIALLNKAVLSGNAEIAVFLSSLAAYHKNTELSLDLNALALTLGHPDAQTNEKLLLKNLLPNNFSQNSLIRKTRSYLLHTNQLYPKKYNSHFTPEGYCLGLIELWYFSIAQNMENEFMDRYARLCLWDGNNIDDISIDMEKNLGWMSFLQNDLNITKVSTIQDDLVVHESLLSSELKLSNYKETLVLKGKKSDTILFFIAYLDFFKESSQHNPLLISVTFVPEGGEETGHAVGFRSDGTSYYAWDTNDPLGCRIFPSFLQAAIYLYRNLVRIPEGRPFSIFVRQFFTRDYLAALSPQQKSERAKAFDWLRNSFRSALMFGLMLRARNVIPFEFLLNAIKENFLLRTIDTKGYSGLMTVLACNDSDKFISCFMKSPQLLDKINFNQKAVDGATALYLAVEKKNAAFVRFLLSTGALMSIANEKVTLAHSHQKLPKFSLLGLAILNEDIETIKILLAYGHPLTPALINHAARTQNRPLLEILISLHCPINADFALYYEKSSLEIKTLCESYQKNPSRFTEPLFKRILNLLAEIEIARNKGWKALQSENPNSSKWAAFEKLSLESQKLRQDLAQNIMTPENLYFEASAVLRTLQAYEAPRFN